MKETFILGVSAFYHDPAAALLRNGDIVTAAQEVRFSRKKHDPFFPPKAKEYFLKKTGINAADLAIVAFYDKLFLKFERLLETCVSSVPFGLGSFLSAILSWIKQKFFLNETAILTVDGVGEWATSIFGKGEGNAIAFLQETRFPHSFGLLYLAFTFYCGFKVNSDEYILMGC